MRIDVDIIDISLDIIKCHRMIMARFMLLWYSTDYKCNIPMMIFLENIFRVYTNHRPSVYFMISTQYYYLVLTAHIKKIKKKQKKKFPFWYNFSFKVIYSSVSLNCNIPTSTHWIMRKCFAFDIWNGWMVHFYTIIFFSFYIFVAWVVNPLLGWPNWNGITWLWKCLDLLLT